MNHMQFSQADPPIGTTVSAIRALSSTLAPSELRVAEVCMTRAAEVAWWSVADVAENASTSTATVIRACQNLGFKGFQHLRMLLLRDLGAAGNGTAAEPGAGVQGVSDLHTMFNAVCADLSGALAPLNPAMLDDAVSALVSAGRVLIVGNGSSAPSAAAFAFSLAFRGRPAEAPMDVVAQQIAAQNLRKGDACVAVSSSGMNAFTLPPAAAAKESGATVIGVTSYARSTLLEICDIGLVVGNANSLWDNHEEGSAIVQLTFLMGLQRLVSKSRADSDMATERSMAYVLPMLDTPGQ
jgi:DNA-binding MurR/RpiR family transcriptional regulator